MINGKRPSWVGVNEKTGERFEQYGPRGEDHDECFTYEKLGTFNATAVKRDYVKHPHKFRRGFMPLTEDYIQYIWNKVDIDKMRLAQMFVAAKDHPDLARPERAASYADTMRKKLCYPMVALETDVRDLEIELASIDGHHRVLIWWIYGIRKAPAIIVPKSRMEHYRVYYCKVLADGTREPLPEGELLQQIWGKYGLPG